MSAVFDPVTGGWTMIPPPPSLTYIGDVPSTVLADGSFIFGSKLDRTMWSLDPSTSKWSQVPGTAKNDGFAEEGFTLLTGGSVFTIAMTTSPRAEHFVLSLSAWEQDGLTPVGLTSPTDSPGG